MVLPAPPAPHHHDAGWPCFARRPRAEVNARHRHLDLDSRAGLAVWLLSQRGTYPGHDPSSAIVILFDPVIYPIRQYEFDPTASDSRVFHSSCPPRCRVTNGRFSPETLSGNSCTIG